MTVDIERYVRIALLAGAYTSIALILFGAILFVLSGEQGGSAVAVRELFAQTSQMKPTAFLSLGILVLIATPVVRVIVATATLSKNREWLYTAFGLVVLTVLMVSFATA